MAEAKTFYLTTPIFYPNGAPHIGHAYTAMATDLIARFERLDGKDVWFQTGTDEHGLKMQQTATEQGITPIELADKNSAAFRAMEDALGCSYDDYIRTTEPRHHAACQEIWRRMQDAGDIYADTYAGWYSVRQEAFYDEKETEVGDDGVRRETEVGTPVEWKEEASYFFRLSAFEDRLLAHYEAHPEFILPNERRNEVISFVKGGLQDLSISRTSFDWGVPVPTDDKHVMYVWVDALTNYITATGFPDEGHPNAKFWPADVHIIGKDIIRFHAVYWPAFLMSAGLPLPKRVFAHGFMMNRGEKMSKSVGNVVDPHDQIAAYGVDQVRYFFMREAAFGADGNYNHDAIVNSINSGLANGLGNLAQRSLSMIAKNCDGQVPEAGPLTEADQSILASVDGVYAAARPAMDQQAIKTYLDAVWSVIAEADRYFDGQAPWDLRKKDLPRMATVLYVTAEVVRQLAILAQPVIPDGAGKLLDLLNVAADKRGFDALGEAGRLVVGTELPKPSGVFPRYVEPDANAKGGKV